MKNKDKENFTQVPNRILEKLCALRIPSYEISCVLIIIRKTYGHHKDKDWISLSQFSGIANIKKQHICRSLNGLLKKRIIIKNYLSPRRPQYSLNHNVSEWVLPNQVIPNKADVPDEVIDATQGGNNNIPGEGDTKEKRKDTIEESMKRIHKAID